MTGSTSELISDYEQAKLELEKLISENTNLNDALVRTYDRKVDLSLKRLLSEQLHTESEIVTRIRYLLRQIGSQHDSCGIIATMIQLIEADLGKLTFGDEDDLAYESKSLEVQTTNNLIELCYRSKASIALADPALEELHNNAMENNSRDDITGILVYDEASESFLQVLEGPKQNVHNLLVRLLLDSRHENISVKFKGPIKKRMYENWSLMLAKTSDLKADNLSNTEKLLSFHQLKDISDASDANPSHQWLMTTLHSAMVNEQQFPSSK